MKYKVRAVQINDFYKDHIQLLNQLTTAPEISYSDYHNQLINIIKQNGYIYVIEDNKTNKIIASATLLIEYKLIHQCGKVGHIEDVVVDQNYRGKGLGKMLLEHCLIKAQEKACYKVILDCNENNITFYAKLGLIKKENQMVKYFNTN